MKVFNLLTACAIAAPLLFVSCSDDAVTTPDTADGVRISFSLSVSAGPAGGLSRADNDLPDGQAYDLGLPGEREVNNAMIVIYDRPINTAISSASNGSASVDEGKVVKVLYLENLGEFDEVTNETEPSYFDPVPSFYPQTDVVNIVKVGTTKLSDTRKQEILVKDDILEIGKRYYAIALCNFGNEKTYDNNTKTLQEYLEGMTLKQFRDHIYTGDLYTANPGKIMEYSNFRMTGINECSFIWERNTTGTLDLGSYLVQRLAARVDVSLGTQGEDLTITADDFMLAIYKQEGTGKPTLMTDEAGNNVYFYLTDLKIVNAVNSGSYLIERSSPFPPTYKDESNNPATPVYLDNEGWQGNFLKGDRKASKYVYSPLDKTYRDNIYSLVAEAGYSKVNYLINGGFFGGENSTVSYDKKKNSAVVGYLPENTCSDTRYSMLRIEGYTFASTSDIFAGSRADYTGMNHVVGDIPIRHNYDDNSHVMDYGVVRNTIYRIRVKVVANDNKIYFRYYYIEPSKDTNNPNTQQKEYEVVAFNKTVSDNNQDEITPND